MPGCDVPAVWQAPPIQSRAVAKKAQDRKIAGYFIFPACVHIKRMFEFRVVFDDRLEGEQCRRICHC